MKQGLEGGTRGLKFDLTGSDFFAIFIWGGNANNHLNGKSFLVQHWKGNSNMLTIDLKTPEGRCWQFRLATGRETLTGAGIGMRYSGGPELVNRARTLFPNDLSVPPTHTTGVVEFFDVPDLGAEFGAVGYLRHVQDNEVVYFLMFDEPQEQRFALRHQLEEETSAQDGWATPLV